MLFTDEEIEYLRNLRFIKSDFADFLTVFRFQRKFITVETDGPHLRIRATGPVVHVMGFEIYVLYIVNELYFRRFDQEAAIEEARKRLALKIAQFLEGHAAIDKVNYPGLESHPRHNRARELFDGFGGVLSFEVKGGVDAAERFIQRVRLPIVAPSLGGVETLVTRPVTTSHSGMSREDRARLGITDSLIRVSVGIEATEEIIEDFDQALRSL